MMFCNHFRAAFDGAAIAHAAYMERRELNDLAYRIIEAAIQVHRTLGPGLLESIYRACLIYELRNRGSHVLAEQLVPIIYAGLIFEGNLRLDLLVEHQIVVEVKSVEAILPVHRAQLRSYLKLANKPLGLLINFNVAVLFHGVKRVINGYPEETTRSAASSELPNSEPL